MKAERTEALVRRIHEVEQEITRVHGKRAKEAEARDLERVRELEALVVDTEARLRTQVAVRRKVARPTSPFRNMRAHLYFLGGLLSAMGLTMIAAAVHLRTEGMLVAIGAAPGLIGVFILAKAYRAKTMDDLEIREL